MSSGVHAPELQSNLGWLNTDRALLLAGELRGQIVVVDFWTYCCINCIHILPDLAWLEDKYAHDPVMFIGVHSAKFTNEASRETIRSAILRYEIQHPVLIDENMKLWRAYAVRSWPTVVVIDPRGFVVGVAAGEGNRAVLDDMIKQTLASGRADRSLAAGPVKVQREQSVRAVSGLAFPGKVFADAESRRLYVADSNHNRMVIAEWPDADGVAQVVRVVGSGAVGRADGPADRATFNHPQGLCVGQGNLYIADTENHLIRGIDLETFAVSTIVGTGEMDNDRAGGGMGTAQGLNSPWDLTIEGSTLYVAMAGIHQIWRIDLPVGFARALAGSGRENLVDGPTETAALAQPSGICICGDKIYFADSEVSAIRGIDMASEKVFTVIGQGLFYFGDVDGVHPKAKLQHPLGVAAWGKSLLVADTYNHKIKLVDPGARSVRTLFGGEKTGTDAGSFRFNEPGGLSVCGDDLFIADTNNHRIVRVNLKSAQTHEIILQGLLAADECEAPTTGIMQAATAHVACGRDFELVLDLRLPKQAHWNAEAPWSIRISKGGHPSFQSSGRSPELPLKVTVPARFVDASAKWLVSTAYAYCLNGDGSLCVPAEAAWELAVDATGYQERVVLTGGAVE